MRKSEGEIRKSECGRGKIFDFGLLISDCSKNRPDQST